MDDLKTCTSKQCQHVRHRRQRGHRVQCVTEYGVHESKTLFYLQTVLFPGTLTRKSVPRRNIFLSVFIEIHFFMFQISRFSNAKFVDDIDPDVNVFCHTD